MAEELNSASKKVELAMNLGKTKVMTNGEKSKILIDGQVLEFVDEYKYFGQIVAFEDWMTKELKSRIDSGWKN